MNNRCSSHAVGSTNVKDSATGIFYVYEYRSSGNYHTRRNIRTQRQDRIGRANRAARHFSLVSVYNYRVRPRKRILDRYSWLRRQSANLALDTYTISAIIVLYEIYKCYLVVGQTSASTYKCKSAVVTIIQTFTFDVPERRQKFVTSDCRLNIKNVLTWRFSVRGFSEKFFNLESLKNPSVIRKLLDFAGRRYASFAPVIALCS